MEIKAHWEDTYRTKAPTQVGWYQDHLRLSLDFIRRTGVPGTGQIVDAGGGASTLVDDLLGDGFRHITVLDLSASALHAARRRLGARAAGVTWIEADITQSPLPQHFYDVWHDRAVFHFLTQPEERQRYVRAVRHAVKPGGHVILATFAPDGPPRCSGLEVVRYSPESLHHEFGEDFRLIDHAREAHVTPFGTEQRFIYCHCRKRGVQQVEARH
jgi:SAM-dependent methyltransferase